MYLFKVFSFLSLVVLLSVGCGQSYDFKQGLRTVNSSNGIASPTPTDPVVVVPDASGSVDFALKSNQAVFTQDSYPTNTVTAQFRLFNSNGLTINGLNKSQIKVTDGGQTVSNLTLSTQTVGIDHVADIVVVLDVTTSMDPSIEQVKTKMAGFVDALKKSNVKANLCLVMFGETTEQKCDHWVLDDPNTANNENLDDFLKQIKAISTHGGGNESDENQLPAIESAALDTPWHQDVQRVAILVTDAGFHYAPENIGEGKNVPTYEHTMGVIKAAGMQTFVIGAPWGGFAYPLHQLPSMPDATGGSFYSLSDMLNGTYNMASIFNSIAGRISSSYTVTYTMEDNPNLDPSLSLAQRNIQITVDPSLQGTLKMQGVASSLPNGRPKFKNRFPVSSTEVDSSTAAVLVNNIPVAGVILSGGDVVFTEAPPAGAEIRVIYFHKNIKEDLVMGPITFQSKETYSKVSLTVNGQAVSADLFSFTHKAPPSYVIEFKDGFFSLPWDIKKLGHMKVDYTAHQ